MTKPDEIEAAERRGFVRALERAAQECDEHAEYFAAQRIRALIPPAAAPAADYDPITAPIPEGDMNGPHGPLPAAETGKAAITYVNAEQWAAAGQAPLDDMKPREPGCQCHQEEGDSPCPVHGEETGKAKGAEGWPFDRWCADALADEVAVLIQRKVIDSRSPAADALLDYRSPPRTPRSDRLAELEALVAEANRQLARLAPRAAPPEDPPAP